MRVTKTVKEYITEEVKNKIYERYSDKRKIAEEQIKILDEIKQNAEAKAKRVYLEEIYRTVKDYDFIEVDSDLEDHLCISIGYRIRIKNRQCIDGVHCWRSRANDEVKKIVNQIIVTLELGGNKEDLDRMLKEI